MRSAECGMRSAECSLVQDQLHSWTSEERARLLPSRRVRELIASEPSVRSAMPTETEETVTEVSPAACCTPEGLNPWDKSRRSLLLSSVHNRRQTR